MSENVIEQKIERIRSHYCENGPLGESEAALRIADELQAATRPEQFMPPLRDWPEDAEWCVIDADGTVSFPVNYCVMRPECGEWDSDSAVSGLNYCEFIPLGIDWRTCKVSRSDMERWEAEQ